MKKRLLFVLVTMVAVLVLVTSCSDDKATEPKRDVATPTFNPPGGSYTDGQQITINWTYTNTKTYYLLLI